MLSSAKHQPESGPAASSGHLTNESVNRGNVASLCWGLHGGDMPGSPMGTESGVPTQGTVICRIYPGNGLEIIRVGAQEIVPGKLGPCLACSQADPWYHMAPEHCRVQ